MEFNHIVVEQLPAMPYRRYKTEFRCSASVADQNGFSASLFSTDPDESCRDDQTVEKLSAQVVDSKEKLIAEKSGGADKLVATDNGYKSTFLATSFIASNGSMSDDFTANDSLNEASLGVASSDTASDLRAETTSSTDEVASITYSPTEPTSSWVGRKWLNEAKEVGYDAATEHGKENDYGKGFSDDDFELTSSPRSMTLLGYDEKRENKTNIHSPKTSEGNGYSLTDAFDDVLASDFPEASAPRADIEDDMLTPIKTTNSILTGIFLDCAQIATNGTTESYRISGFESHLLAQLEYMDDGVSPAAIDTQPIVCESQPSADSATALSLAHESPDIDASSVEFPAILRTREVLSVTCNGGTSEYAGNAAAVLDSEDDHHRWIAEPVMDEFDWLEVLPEVDVAGADWTRDISQIRIDVRLLKAESREPAISGLELEKLTAEKVVDPVDTESHVSTAQIEQSLVFCGSDTNSYDRPTDDELERQQQLNMNIKSEGPDEKRKNHSSNGTDVMLDVDHTLAELDSNNTDLVWHQTTSGSDSKDTSDELHDQHQEQVPMFSNKLNDDRIEVLDELSDVVTARDPIADNKGGRSQHSLMPAMSPLSSTLGNSFDDEDTVTDNEFTSVQHLSNRFVPRDVTAVNDAPNSMEQAMPVAIVPAANQTCKQCGIRVYEMEKLIANQNVYHKTCFRCDHCQRILSLANFAAFEGQVYCTPHFTELFVTKGNCNSSSEMPKDSENSTEMDHDDSLTLACEASDQMTSTTEREHGVSRVSAKNMNEISLVPIEVVRGIFEKLASDAILARKADEIRNKTNTDDFSIPRRSSSASADSRTPLAQRTQTTKDSSDVNHPDVSKTTGSNRKMFSNSSSRTSIIPEELPPPLFTKQLLEQFRLMEKASNEQKLGPVGRNISLGRTMSAPNTPIKRVLSGTRQLNEATRLRDPMLHRQIDQLLVSTPSSPFDCGFSVSSSDAGAEELILNEQTAAALAVFAADEDNEMPHRGLTKNLLEQWRHIEDMGNSSCGTRTITNSKITNVDLLNRGGLMSQSVSAESSWQRDDDMHSVATRFSATSDSLDILPPPLMAKYVLAKFRRDYEAESQIVNGLQAQTKKNFKWEVKEVATLSHATCDGMAKSAIQLRTPRIRVMSDTVTDRDQDDISSSSRRCSTSSDVYNISETAHCDSLPHNEMPEPGLTRTLLALFQSIQQSHL